MTLTQAIIVARRVIAEHGGIEVQTLCMRPHATPINPDNTEQEEIAAAFNTLQLFTSLDSA